jgi:hypothetical protein
VLADQVHAAGLLDEADPRRVRHGPRLQGDQRAREAVGIHERRLRVRQKRRSVDCGDAPARSPDRRLLILVPIAYIAWSVWLIALGIALIVNP